MKIHQVTDIMKYITLKDRLRSEIYFPITKYYFLWNKSTLIIHKTM